MRARNNQLLVFCEMLVLVLAAPPPASTFSIKRGQPCPTTSISLLNSTTYSLPDFHLPLILSFPLVTTLNPPKVALHLSLRGENSVEFAVPLSSQLALSSIGHYVSVVEPFRGADDDDGRRNADCAIFLIGRTLQQFCQRSPVPTGTPSIRSPPLIFT